MRQRFDTIYAEKQTGYEVKQVVDTIIEETGGIFSSADAQRMGISRTMLGKYVKSGLLERVAHGVYAARDALLDGLYVLQLRSPRLVFSHETALWLNGLTDRDPLTVAVTIPSGAPLGARLRGECVCHYVKPELMELGLSKAKTIYGREVRCYSPERTICDIVRSEARTGVENFFGGLKAYAARRDKDISELMKIASAFGIEETVSKYMGVLT